MKGVRLHWSLHPDKAQGLYYDETGKPRSPWYDNEIEAKQMTKAAVARELDISYEMSVEGIVYPEFRESHILKSKYRDWETDRKSTRLNSSHSGESRMPSSA